MADNVTPIRPDGNQPPASPRKPREPRRRQKVEIAFGGVGEGPNTLLIWQGLHGVCCQLRDMGGSTDDVDQYVRLSAAAAVLAGLLDDRLMLRCELRLALDAAEVAQ
jgi:hypothetical protein